MSFKVGDKLWYVPNGNYGSSNQYEVEISKIGNKWMTVVTSSYIREMKIDKCTLQVDGKGYVSPGKCYLRKEDFEQEKLSGHLFDQLRRKLGYSTKALPIDIIEAGRLLGIILEIEK